MTSTLIGIVVEKETHKVLRVIVPDKDAELMNPSYKDAATEDILLVDRETVGSLGAVEEYVRNAFDLATPKTEKNIEFINATYLEPVGTPVNASVPVVTTNAAASPGLEGGGVLNMVRDTIEIVCGADEVPENFTLDLTGLEISDQVSISALSLPERVRPIPDDREFTILVIADPAEMA